MSKEERALKKMVQKKTREVTVPQSQALAARSSQPNAQPCCHHSTQH